jgi:hypothetical protein
MSPPSKAHPLLPSPYTLFNLESTLPFPFSTSWPQVLTHSDLSRTGLLLDPNTYAPTSLVHWSLAGSQPFGLELGAALFVLKGCMDLVRGRQNDIALPEAVW